MTIVEIPLTINCFDDSFLMTQCMWGEKLKRFFLHIEI